MKKIILIITIVSTMMACNSERTAETINKEIQSKESSIEKLNSEISELKKELRDMQPDSVYTGKKIVGYNK